MIRRRLEAMSLFKLRDLARKKGYFNISSLSNDDIIGIILNLENETQEVKNMFNKEKNDSRK